jgi:hypothetical protein
MQINGSSERVAPGTEGREAIRAGIDRANARMRHFRSVAASLMRDALTLWEDIWIACEDPRSVDEILEGVPPPRQRMPACGWEELRNKLHELRHYIDQAKRFCDGSVP